MVVEIVQTLGLIMAVGGIAAEVLGTAGGVYYPLRKRIPLTPLELISLGGCSFFAGLVAWAAAAYFQQRV